MPSRLVAGLCVLGVAASAGADEDALLRKIEALEQRVQELEAERALRDERTPPAAESSRTADWTRRLRISGSSDQGFFGGGDDSQTPKDGFDIWDARFFLDAGLGQDVGYEDLTLFRDIGLSFEWDLVRIGSLQNDVGDLYVDFQGVGDSDWLNFQVGRFQIPVGEAYLHYGKGYSSNPFVSNSFGPWYWDEGVKLYSLAGQGRFGYVASVENGDTPFNVDSDADKQVTLKLFADPFPWLHLSVSGLRSGQLGSNDNAASGSLWLGESWARAFGAGSSVPNYQDGVQVPDGPNKIHDTWLVDADAIVDLEDKARLWLGYGQYHLDSTGGTFYDRTLRYWIAELILRGAWLGEPLRPFYAGVRGQSYGTTDTDKGYLLDFRRASTLGYNMQQLTSLSAVLGWDITDWLRLRGEYTRLDIDLVRGVGQDMRDDARDADYFAVELGAHF
jgi:hypothetical protein